MFIFFACLYALFLRVQRKRTSSEAAKEKTAYHSPFHCWPSAFLRCSQSTDASESRGVYTPLRGAPPNRLSVLCCAARLREMASTSKKERSGISKNELLYIVNDAFGFICGNRYEDRKCQNPQELPRG